MIEREDRDARIVEFLSDSGWFGANRVPLAGDASFRRYDRVFRAGESAVLMDAPPPQEDVRPFSRLARHLLGLGLSAPRILSEDAGSGFLLIEDLGDATYTRALNRGDDPFVLYALAVDVLAHLHGLPASVAVPRGLPRYDERLLLDEACLLTDWYLPAMRGRRTHDAMRESYRDAWRATFPAVFAQPETLVLRDYHVDNLLVLADRNGIARCGILDFQDAVVGAAAYDLMSLLEDARRDVDGSLQSAMKARYFNARQDMSRSAFDMAYAILAAQRHAKVIGIFTRLCIRDRKPTYLQHLPRLWRLLENALRHPVLAPVAEWFEYHVTEELRGIPACMTAPS